MAKLPAAALDAVVACVPASAPKGRVTPDFRAKLSWGGRCCCPAVHSRPRRLVLSVRDRVGVMRGLIRQARGGGRCPANAVMLQARSCWRLEQRNRALVLDSGK